MGHTMEMERFEAEIKDLSQRVSKLEPGRKGWRVARRNRGLPILRHIIRVPRTRQDKGNPPTGLGSRRSNSDRSRPSSRISKGSTHREHQRVIETINAKSPLWLKDRRRAEKEFLRPFVFRLRGGLESSLYDDSGWKGAEESSWRWMTIPSSAR